MASHRFIGDRDAPDRIVDVQGRRPLLGTGTLPEELQRMAARKRFYVQPPERGKPSVEIVSVADGDRELWEIEVPIDDALRGARLGRSAERRSPEQHLAEVDEDVSFHGFRPDWMDALHVPRISLGKQLPSLRRFNGRAVRPLWVYDHARHEFRDTAYPLGCVGRLFNSEGESGTAALVGDRLVITAGHMVPWGQRDWWMRFVPAYYNGSSLFGAGVESYVSDGRGYDVQGDVTGYDWAVLRLYEPLGSLLGYFGYNGYSSDWNDLGVWSNVGYPGDIANAERPSFQQGFTIDDTDGDSNGGRELESENADLNHGNSGGPMYAWWGNDPRIVGVVSGEETESNWIFWTLQDNVFASGEGFTNLCAWGRSSWPA